MLRLVSSATGYAAKYDCDPCTGHLEISRQLVMRLMKLESAFPNEIPELKCVKEKD